ncbi:unnamed protein product [Orchesella dallaii]|uniref:Uncharacterized protein n=1 Tax=Orchesella dallaii TaxID=48710 RepID=A0ABP1RYF7_9HEXA
MVQCTIQIPMKVSNTTVHVGRIFLAIDPSEDSVPSECVPSDSVGIGDCCSGISYNSPNSVAYANTTLAYSTSDPPWYL